MIEHKPWVGSNYHQTPGGQRIAIVGYSHWLGRSDAGSIEADSPDTTLAVVGKVVSGEWADIKFFNRIAGYFGASDRAAFWNDVLFFNFIPDAIGSGDQRYDHATREQIERGGERLRRIMVERRPDKLLVFTMKGWRTMPKRREEEAGDPLMPLGNGESEFEWGTYEADGHIVAAFGLMHPQYASTERMTSAVNIIRLFRV